MPEFGDYLSRIDAMPPLWPKPPKWLVVRARHMKWLGRLPRHQDLPRTLPSVRIIETSCPLARLTRPFIGPIHRRHGSPELTARLLGKGGELGLPPHIINVLLANSIKQRRLDDRYRHAQ